MLAVGIANAEPIIAEICVGLHASVSADFIPVHAAPWGYGAASAATSDSHLMHVLPAAIACSENRVLGSVRGSIDQPGSCRLMQSSQDCTFDR